MAMNETGGCLCGKITFRLEREAVITAHHCHCKDCQKVTGTGKSTIVVVPTNAIETTGELKTWTVTGTMGKHINRGFCGECGSHVMTLVDELPDIRIVKAGSLDDSSWLKVISSYWCESAASWAQPNPDLPAFDQNPT